jgi:hypothetical protein
VSPYFPEIFGLTIGWEVVANLLPAIADDHIVRSIQTKLREGYMPRHLYIIIFAALITCACGGNSSDGGGGEGKQASLNFEILSTASTTSGPSAMARNSGLIEAAVAHGQVTSSGLTSLKYYITDISICKNMTINGTGYSGQSGCITVFSAERSYDYDTFIAEDAEQETELYVDLMSSVDLSRLAETTFLSSDDIGDYYYGKVDHYRPVKLTASIRLNDDTVVYTKSGTSTRVSGSGIGATYVTYVSDITTGPAQESIVVLPNGGSWFKFEKPFTITSEDIENETAFQMKLAFNPEGVLKAYNYASSNQAIQDQSNNYGIVMPLMPFTPVIFRTTETARKESYLFSYTSAMGSTYNSFDFRLELYTVEEDASDSIYAADTLQLLLRDYQQGQSDVTQIFRPFFVTASNDATPVYCFVNWLDNDFITDFTRGTYVGDTGTATFHVDESHSVTMDVLLRSIETIEADSTIETISLADLTGRWIGPCVTTDSASQKEIYDFDDEELLLTTIDYSDAACTVEKESLVRNFSLELIDNTITDDGDDVKQINFAYNSLSLTPKTSVRADELNTAVHCGYNDWQVDQTKQLLGQDNCMGLNHGDVVYDIYLVSGTDLYLGDSAAATAGNRPTVLGDTATAGYTGDIP